MAGMSIPEFNHQQVFHPICSSEAPPATEREEIPSFSSSSPADPTLVFFGALKSLQDQLQDLRANPDRTYQDSPACTSSTKKLRAHSQRRLTYMSKKTPLSSSSSSPREKAAQPENPSTDFDLPPLDLRHQRVRPQRTLVHHPSCYDVFSTTPLLFDQLAISPRIPNPQPEPSSSSSSPDAHHRFRECAPLFFSITNSTASFSSKEAAEQIRTYISTPDGKEQALDFFCQLYNLGNAEWYVQRWNLLLADIILDPECYGFIESFISRKQMDVEAFAKGIVQGLHESDASLERVIDILSLYTQEDLKKHSSEPSGPRSLFSTLLYREYGFYLLQRHIPHSFSIANQTAEFSSAMAREEILAYLRSGNGAEQIAAFIAHFFPLENGQWYEARWNSLLADLFLNPDSHSFIRGLIGKNKHKVDLFAKRIADGFLHLDANVNEVIAVLSLCTQEDIQGQTPETMFRGTDLSTSLYREYGLVLLHTTMQNWAEILDPFLERMDECEFCLKMPLIAKSLYKTDSPIDTLPEEKQAQCLEKQKVNFENNKGFFSAFLDQFYKTPIPVEFQKLVASQREHIYEKLAEVEIAAISEQSFSSAEEKDAAIANAKATAVLQSEVLICQLIILRMLNPWLISLAQKDPIRQEAILNLTKMIQSLANQVPFGLKESTLEPYNCIYHDFIEIHRFWIHNYFPLMSLLHGGPLPPVCPASSE